MPPKTESTDSHSRQYRGGKFNSSRQTNTSRFNNLEASSEQPSQFRGNCKFSKTSLREQTGNLKSYKDKHGSTLPYILISSPFGRKLRFLIETGASNSFIDPTCVPLQQRESLSTNTVIKTVLKEIQVTEKVEYPVF